MGERDAIRLCGSTAVSERSMGITMPKDIIPRNHTKVLCATAEYGRPNHHRLYTRHDRWLQQISSRSRHRVLDAAGFPLGSIVLLSSNQALSARCSKVECNNPGRGCMWPPYHCRKANCYRNQSLALYLCECKSGRELSPGPSASTNSILFAE